jgi:hypothetical protein
MPDLQSAVATHLEAIAEQGTALVERGDYNAALRERVIRL